MLRTVGQEDKKDWDEKLPKIILAYRSSVHSSTKFTPHFLMFGREIQLPIDLMYWVAGDRFKSENAYAGRTKDALEQAFDKVNNNIERTQTKQKKYYDRRKRGAKIQEGDQVMLYSPAHKKGLSKKLHRFWKVVGLSKKGLPMFCLEFKGLGRVNAKSCILTD